jgi:cell division septal protein FtsQ
MSHRLRHPWRLGLIIMCVTAVVGGAAYLLGWSSFFSINSVSLSVTGPSDPHFNSNQFINQYLDQHQDNPQVGTPIARLDVNQITNQLSTLQWIDHTDISRGWFSGKIEIKVSERIPVAMMGTGVTNEYIDQGGVVFHSPKNYGSLPQILFPSRSAQTVTSLAIENTQNDLNSSNNNGAQGNTDQQGLHSVAAYFVTHIPASLLNTVQSISFYRSDDIELETTLRSPSLLIKWGGLDQMKNKLTVLSQLLSLKENSQISLVDLTDPSSPIVK